MTIIPRPHQDIEPQPPSSPCPICGHAETWRPVINFEGMYEVSSIGRLKSFPMVRNTGWGPRTIPGRISVPRRGSHRYPRAILSKRVGEPRYLALRDIVASAFLSAPTGGRLHLVDGSQWHCCVGNMQFRFPEFGYHSTHGYVRKVRGSARNFPCVDCSQPAEHWSYNHNAPDGFEIKEGCLTWSRRPDDYDPRCSNCHYEFDKPYMLEHVASRPRRADGTWLPREVA